MRAPTFWWKKNPGFFALCLWPVSFVYGMIASRRLHEPGARATAPVICVGNFVMGGAGKTPTAIALARLLKVRGETPVFLTRGYGGALSSPTPLVVRLEHHYARDVGDEALLLANVAPTVVCIDRVAGALAAVDAGASVIVMDDGLQNPTLVKNLSFAVVDGGSGIGNGLTFPAGPLRAPMTAQIPLVSMAVLVGDGEPGNRAAARLSGKAIRIFRAKLAPRAAIADCLRGRKVIAFAGIGRPEKFFVTLEETGAQIVARHAFDDHHMFSSQELRGLVDEARAADALLVTTEKDFVRLPAGVNVMALPVELVFDRPDNVDQLLTSELKRLRASR